MRIIKLSSKDADMQHRQMVDEFFTRKLSEYNPPGRFEIPKGWISATGIERNELLVFSYEGDIVYLARSASGRLQNADSNSSQFPHFFIIDLSTLAPASGTLSQLEQSLASAGLHQGHLVQSQGWPKVSEANSRTQQLERVLDGFRHNFLVECAYLEGERRAATTIARSAKLRIAAKLR